MPTKPEGPAQEPQVSEPTHKLPESLPYQMMIGDLRRCLFTRGDSAWNGYIRDMTAELEDAGEYVNVAEAFSRINAKAAKMMGVLEFQKAMGVPATPAPSQPAGARVWLMRRAATLPGTCPLCKVIHAGNCPDLDYLCVLLEDFAREQTSAKDARIQEQHERAERAIEVSLHEKNLREAAERERDSLRAWKDAVLRAIKNIPEFTTGVWGGDKEGWGFCFELVNWLQRHRAELETENAALNAGKEQ